MSDPDFSSVSDVDAVPFTISPSISRARWASYALGKLREGYALLQSPRGTVFQFVRAGEPVQPCSALAAKKLLAMGLVTPDRTDVRGTRYVLRAAFQPEGAEA